MHYIFAEKIIQLQKELVVLSTIWNEKGISQGRSQNRLSKNGIALAQNIESEEFPNMGICLDDEKFRFKKGQKP